MTVFQAIILGALQGVTEFLPISSSGHLILVPHILHWSPQGIGFDVAIHVATLLAILFELRMDIAKLIKSFIRDPRDHLFLKLIVGTIPVGLVGLLLSDDLLSKIRTLPVVAGCLIGWGVVLALVDLYSRQQKGESEVKNVAWWQAIVVGVMQVFALIPGTSRSGVTMSTGLLTGMDRATAVKFSFLLSIPAIIGAAVLTGKDAAQVGFGVSNVVLFTGFISAFLSGILSIKVLLKVISRWSFLPFAAYRIALGLIILLFFV